MAFGVANLILLHWDLHDLFSGSPVQGSHLLFPILLLVLGVWLANRAKAPRGPMTAPILVAGGCIAGALCIMAIGSLFVIPDERFVQQGSYEDICPGRTVSEILSHGHEEVVWTSYLNIYGYRSVSAVCTDSEKEPRIAMVWSIDDDNRFWVQYAARDGVQVDPYQLLDQLCRKLPSDD